MFHRDDFLNSMCEQWEQTGGIADSLAVSATLQLLYLLKFFWWEGGYLNTLSMMHDRGKRFFCGDMFNGNKLVDELSR